MKGGDVEVALRFINAGESGVWLSDPARLDDDTDDEHSALWYAVREAEDDPDVTPLPLSVERARLTPIDPAPSLMMLLAGGSTLKRRCRATLELESAGTLLLRASWASYIGGDSIAGRARLRGCAFSNELSVAAG